MYIYTYKYSPPPPPPPPRACLRHSDCASVARSRAHVGPPHLGVTALVAQGAAAWRGCVWSCANVIRSRGFGRASQIAQRPHPPDATFVAFSTVTAPTAAETKFAPHTLGAIREGAPSPRWCAVHVSGLDRERTAHGGWVPIFDPFRADLQIPALNLQIAGASSQSA